VVAPSGRLPISVPRSAGQLPVYYRHRAGGGRSQIHQDYVDGPTAPLFPFGHGLGYTTFAYDDLAVSATSTSAPLAVSVRVRNTGARAGVEAVQCYVRDDVASVVRPRRMLVGFARVALPRGAERIVRFSIPASRLAFYDPSMRFVVEPGAFTVWVGASAADLRQEAQVELSGPVAEFRQAEIPPTTVSVE